MRLPNEQLLSFERVGHCHVQRLLHKDHLEQRLPAINAAYEAQQLDIHRQKLRVLLGEDALTHAESASGSDQELLSAIKKRLAALPSGSAPFLQAFNLWRISPEIAALACDPAIVGAAAGLLGEPPRMRLYQDSLFVKRPGDGETHWHSDLAMSPLDTNQFVTCWLPLQDVPAEKDGGTGLIFASGSHRDVALSYWHSAPPDALDATGRGYAESLGKALSVGDATFHHGWTLHCAAPNMRRVPRRALAFSYFADGATRLGREAKRAPHNEDAESYAAWLRDVRPGAPARHRLLPIVWDVSKGGAQRIAVDSTTTPSTGKQHAKRHRAGVTQPRTASTGSDPRERSSRMRNPQGKRKGSASPKYRPARGRGGRGPGPAGTATGTRGRA